MGGLSGELSNIGAKFDKFRVFNRLKTLGAFIQLLGGKNVKNADSAPHLSELPVCGIVTRGDRNRQRTTWMYLRGGRPFDSGARNGIRLRHRRRWLCWLRSG